MKPIPTFAPEAVGILLFVIALALALAPYLASVDFGPIKVPSLSDAAKKRLRVLGPILLLLVLLLHLPILPARCEEPVFTEITDAKQCGTMTEEFVVTPERTKSCSHESFGLAGWQYIETVRLSSGWRGGGLSQPEWCDEVKRNFIASRKIGAQHETRTVSSDESARWAGRFNRDRQYNYVCEVEIKWGPQWATREDAAVCGVIPAVKGTRQVPARCRIQTGTKVVPCDA